MLRSYVGEHSLGIPKHIFSFVTNPSYPTLLSLLVPRVVHNVGYSRFSLIRASAVVKLPISFGVVLIAGMLPGVDFLDQGLLV